MKYNKVFIALVSVEASIGNGMLLSKPNPSMALNDNSFLPVE